MIKSSSKAVWGASPAGSTYAKGAAPGTKEFFENVVIQRSTYEMPWLYDLVPFSSYRGKKVLEIGCGAGYDAYEFCRNGVDYTGIDITPENPVRTKKHLGFFGYTPKVLEGDAERLSFKDETFDVVFSNGVLHHTPDIISSFKEAYRILRPSGEFWVIVYHKNSIFYWVTLGLFDHILKFGFLKRSFSERLSMIEYTASGKLPLVNAYSRKELRRMLKGSGFTVESIWVRKLIKEDLPPFPFLGRLWKFIPQRLLDTVGKSFGWYVIARAKKL